MEIDRDGKPDENLKDISEWKPEHNVNEPFEYDTMHFDEPEDPKDDQKGQDAPNKDVQGSYYPGDHVGGALTGDTTNMMMYMELGCMSLGMMLFILFKRKQEE